MKSYKCSCGSEAIHIERLGFIGLDEIQVSIWHQGINKYTLREKVRHCWKVLTTGSPYPDQICLYPVDALEMAKDLEEMSRIAGEQNRLAMEAA